MFALIEAVGCFVHLIFESLVFGITHLAEDGKPVTRRRFLIAMLPITCLIAGCAVFFYMDSVASNRRADTRASVRQTVKALASKLNPDGTIVKTKRLSTKDSWDRPLQVQYTETAAGERVRVWSSGADGLDATGDDISKEITVIMPGKAARVVAKKISDLVRQKIGNDQ